MNAVKKYMFLIGLVCGVALGALLFSNLDVLFAQDGESRTIPPQIAVGKKVRRCVLQGEDQGSYRTIDAIHGSWIVFDNREGSSNKYGCRFECIDLNHPDVAWWVFE